MKKYTFKIETEYVYGDAEVESVTTRQWAVCAKSYSQAQAKAVQWWADFDKEGSNGGYAMLPEPHSKVLSCVKVESVPVWKTTLGDFIAQ